MATDGDEGLAGKGGDGAETEGEEAGLGCLTVVFLGEDADFSTGCDYVRH